MRAFVVILAALSVAGSAHAQEPRLELRATALGLSARRDAEVSPTAVGQGTGFLSGFEVSIRARFIGVAARVFHGNAPAGASSGTITSGDVRAQVGPRLLAVEAGYARRAMEGSLGSTVYSHVRAGLTSIIDIGGTGVDARLGAAIYLAGQGVPGTTVSGHEVIALLEYRLRKLPLSLVGGYRGEVFQASTNGNDRAEHVGAVVVGAGLSLRKF